MDIAKNGCIRDLPPSKRFKFVGSDPGSTPRLPLPAKKRVFPPPLEEEAAAVPVRLPAKKRAIVSPPSENAAPVCLPVKKRSYAPPADAVIMTACLPAKKRPYAPPPPPAALADSVAWPSVLTKKRVHAPTPREGAAGSVPVCLPSKKRVHAPSSREDAVGMVPVCLPSNKRVMPPLPSPSLKSDGARRGAVKDLKPQGSNKHGAAAINPRLANGDEGGARGKEVKKFEKPIHPKVIKEFVPLRPSNSISPNYAKDSEKIACKVPDDKQRKVEVRKEAVEATGANQTAREEEPRNSADEAAREQEQEVEEVQDDGVLCAVCRSTDGDPSDPIVFCDGCDLMVHASCYGNPLAQSIPDGDWFCSLCSAKKSKVAAPARPSCCLCPAKSGAMKRTTEGHWAHIACALLVPEVFFRDPDGRDGVDCSRVPAHRFTTKCYICESSNGCALECSQPKCSRAFHVSCGLDGGLCIEYREGKGGAIVAGFCKEHTELWEKQQLTGKYKIVARGEE